MRHITRELALRLHARRNTPQQGVDGFAQSLHIAGRGAHGHRRQVTRITLPHGFFQSSQRRQVVFNRTLQPRGQQTQQQQLWNDGKGQQTLQQPITAGCGLCHQDIKITWLLTMDCHGTQHATLVFSSRKQRLHAFRKLRRTQARVPCQQITTRPQDGKVKRLTLVKQHRAHLLS